MSQYAHLSKLDPEFAALRHLVPEDHFTVDSDPVQLKQDFLRDVAPVVESQTKNLRPPDSTYTVQDYKVPVDSGEILVRVTTPTKEGPFPALIWAHGGGELYGDVTLDDNALRLLTVKHQIVIVNVEYRTAPEYKWPTCRDDVYAALKWSISNAKRLRVSPGKGLLVGGTSAGAHLAAAAAIRARYDPFFEKHPLTGQILQIPSSVYPEAVPVKYKDHLPSVEQNKDAPALNAAEMKALYSFLGVSASSVEFSPLLAASHAGLPPATVYICGLDPLHDEGLLYERVLREAGVKTKLYVCPGLPHGFHVVLPQMKAAAKYNADVDEGTEWLLSDAV